ncbi:hypothetical protein [Pedobacter sp. SYSU D00535]|uniref:hypothetical protein n=1 Tax=Pedobacter sp. SYSU D00535 TaxID=2810308 RepID=UPI001A978CF8|nr:hypothetical protein [Pedobacter sp. SYSU D00535]
MKKGQLLVVGAALAGLCVTNAVAQTKKQMIETLTARADSLERMLATRTKAFHECEVKFAKLEGVSETREAAAKKAESKADSLLGLLNTKETIIADLNKQLTDLNTEADSLRTEAKTLADQNQSLTSKLAGLNQTEEKAPAAESKRQTIPAVKKEELKLQAESTE